MDIDVNVKDMILKPIDQVFQSIINPDILSIKENELITFDWKASGITTQVDIALIAIDANLTSVIITEKSFQLNNTEVLKAMQQTQGWTDFICSMKAFLYCGINLRNGRTKGSY